MVVVVVVLIIIYLLVELWGKKLLITIIKMLVMDEIRIY